MAVVRVFFFNDTATTEIYTLSLHDALPICVEGYRQAMAEAGVDVDPAWVVESTFGIDSGADAARALMNLDPRPTAIFAVKDRKSTRLNSSHANISYAVFCLEKNTQLLARDE